MIPNLHRSCHFTIPTTCVKDMAYKDFPLLADPMLQNFCTTGTRDVNVNFISKYHNFISDDKTIVVINNDSNQEYSASDSPPSSASLVAKCQGLITKMFEEGLAGSFTFCEKKRASDVSTSVKVNKNSKRDIEASCAATIESTFTTSSRRKKRLKSKRRAASIKPLNIDTTPEVLPTITLGWSTQNAHEYYRHKCTTTGNIRPFLRDGDISAKPKKILLECIKIALNGLPSEKCFNIDNFPDKVVQELRKSMISEFQNLLGGKNQFSSAFRIEGITIVVPVAIGSHCDTLNCGSEGMNMVVSINVKVPISEITVPPSSKLRKWLEQNGFRDSFPLSIILYSRRCVFNHCAKMSQSQSLSAIDDVYKVMHWALVDRVGSPCDFHNQVWCNPEFAEMFMKKAAVKKNSRFQGKMMDSVESYDKTVSTICSCMIQSHVAITISQWLPFNPSNLSLLFNHYHRHITPS